MKPFTYLRLELRSFAVGELREVLQGQVLEFFQHACFLLVHGECTRVLSGQWDKGFHK